MPLHRLTSNDTTTRTTPTFDEVAPYGCPNCGHDLPEWEIQCSASVQLPFYIDIGEDADGNHIVDSAWEGEQGEPDIPEVIDIVCMSCYNVLSWTRHRELIDRLNEIRDNTL